MKQYFIPLYLLFLFCIFYSCTVPERLNNRVSITEDKKNTVQKKYNQLLVLAAGSPTFRLFSETLYKNLSNGLGNKTMKSSFYFLGNNEKEISSKFKNITGSENFDAVMIISQNDTGYITENNEVIFGFQLRNLKTKQCAKLAIFEKNNYTTDIWNIFLNIDINVTGKAAYPKISKKIIENMALNKLIASY